MPGRSERGDPEREFRDERHRQNIFFGPLVLWLRVCVAEMNLTCVLSLIIGYDFGCRLSRLVDLVSRDC